MVRILGSRLTLNKKPVYNDQMYMKNSTRKTFLQTVKQNCCTGDTRAVLEVMLTYVQHNNYEGEGWVVS